MKKMKKSSKMEGKMQSKKQINKFGKKREYGGGGGVVNMAFDL
jgi:hypothetical protein